MLLILTELIAKQLITPKDLLCWINETQVLYASLISEIEKFPQTEQISIILAYTALNDFFSELTQDKDISTKFIFHWTETTDQEVVSESREINFTEEALEYLKLINKESKTVVKKLSKEGISFNIDEILAPLFQYEHQIALGEEGSAEVGKSRIQQKVIEYGIAKVSAKYFGDSEGFFYPLYADKEQAKVIKVLKSLYILRPSQELRQITRNSYLYSEQEISEAKLKILKQAAEYCWNQVKDIETIPQVNADILEKYQARKILQKLMNISLFLNAELVSYRKWVLRLSLRDYIKRSQLPFIKLDQQEQTIIEKIKMVESKFLQLVRGVNGVWSWDEDIDHKKILEQIRITAKHAIKEINIDKGSLTGEEVQQVKKTYQGIAGTIKQTLILHLIKKSITYLGDAPVDFAVLGLGSLAREEMTPYSDFEFAILIKEDAPAIREYFYHFSALINFMVMNLGETVIPRDTFEIPYEDFISPGFQLDLGGKTPLGRLNQNYELIKTPKEMAEYVKEEAFRRGRWLPMEMSTYTYICGDSALCKEYQEYVEQELDKPMRQRVNNEFEASALKVRQVRALRFLSKDANRFDPNLYDVNEEGRLLKVKEDIYRLPNTILEGLSLYYGISESFNTWSKIEELYITEKISREGSLHLQEVFSIATYLRLTVYQNCNAQNETFSVLFSLEPTKSSSLDDKTEYGYCKFGAKQLSIFTEVYKILIPLHSAISSFTKSQGKAGVLLSAAFYDKTPKTLGQIASRLCDYDEVERQFRKMTEEAPQSSFAWYLLGTALLDLQKKEGILEVLQKALELSDEDEILKSKISGTLGKAYGLLGDTQRQIELLERNLKTLEKFYGSEHIHVVPTLNSLGNAYGDLGKVKEKKELLKRALKIEKRFYEQKHINIASTSADLGNAYICLDKIDKAKKLLESVLMIEEKFYGHEHVALAKTLNDLGIVHGRLGNYRKEKELLKRALKIEEKFYKPEHVATAVTVSNLGNVYGKLGNYQKKKELLEHALSIRETFYRSEHFEVANTRFNLGTACQALRYNKQACQYFLSAYKTFLSFYGPNHINTQKVCQALADCTTVDTMMESHEMFMLVSNAQLKVVQKDIDDAEERARQIQGTLQTTLQPYNYGRITSVEIENTEDLEVAAKLSLHIAAQEISKISQTQAIERFGIRAANPVLAPEITVVNDHTETKPKKEESITEKYIGAS